MAKLPPALASDLSKSMGMGATAMAPPPEDDKSDPDSMSEMDHCMSDFVDAVTSGDKDAMMSTLKDLFEAFKEEDADQDASES
jgi:hypothetical protein